MFGKLALRNVKRQIGNYLIYFVTVSITIALMFSINCMTYCEQIRQMSSESENFSSALIATVIFVAVCTAFVLGYATSFMLKLRRREFGMYLTLGMTKKDLIRLFSFENFFLFLAALLTGVFVGLFLYQGLMALLCTLTGVSLTVSAYSLGGLLQTILIGFLMFLLSALASVRYLKKTHISELLRNEKQEKTEKHPFLFLFLSLISFVCILFIIKKEFAAIDTMFQSDSTGASIVLLVPVLGFFVFLFHTFLSRGLVGVLLLFRKHRAKGTNTFLLRQLSGKMRVNSVMLGVLSCLFLFSLLLANISFAARISNENAIETETPFDILARFHTDKEHPVSLEDGTKLINKYAKVKKTLHYAAYENGEGVLRDSVPEYKGRSFSDAFVPVSEFNEILIENGFEPLTLTSEYCMVSRYFSAKEEDFLDTVLSRNGKEYTFQALHNAYPFYIYGFQYAVVPDEFVEGMTKTSDYMAYVLESDHYDYKALYEELTYPVEDDGSVYRECDFDLRALYEEWMNNQIGVIIITLLYIATVFICMALAVLSLKTLSGLREDKQRYLTLHRLGTSRALQCRTLFRQTFSFFALPFAVPFCMTAVFTLFARKLYILQGFPQLVPSAVLCSAAIAFCILCIYALYFIITYQTAKANVISRE